MARIVRRGEFVGPGEELTAAYLEGNLPDDWLVICNKELPREASSRELDLLIVGAHVLFAIDEKHWPGTIRGNEDGWILPSGESEFSPLRKLEDVGKRLRQKLEREVDELKQGQLGSERISGCSVLLSHPDSDPQINDPSCPALKSCDFAAARTIFCASMLDRRAMCLIAPFRSSHHRRSWSVSQISPRYRRTSGPFAVTERVETVGSAC